MTFEADRPWTEVDKFLVMSKRMSSLKDMLLGNRKFKLSSLCGKFKDGIRYRVAPARGTSSICSEPSIESLVIAPPKTKTVVCDSINSLK